MPRQEELRDKQGRTLDNLRAFTVVLFDRLPKLWLRLSASKPLELFGRIDPSGRLRDRRVSGEIQVQRHAG